MYPYVTLFGEKIFMTGVGIVVAFLTFLIVSIYLTRRYHQNFWKFFYWMPILIILCYFLWSYVQFFFDYGAIPTTWAELLTLMSPYGYKFHFVGILIGMVISILIFLKKIKRLENKKIWIDILFYSVTLSLVPLGFFLLMGDNFIGNSTLSWLGIKSLHSESAWNKFNLVYPIGIFLSIWALLVAGFIRVIKKRFGYGLLGFSILLVVMAIILFFQQYPRHGVLAIGEAVFDIKQYAAILVAIRCFLIFRKWRRIDSKE